ncbi:hypothetical protein EIZ62_11510 [Streptomyces ficellus]|uniref:Uncharacterized protein n=1 Tax=Streptomyces ficellus TaxID=1977088 RepID=A0A6I6FIA2_9ACTN|nr:hypothetical protein EIZ62_11510 [Streptomyces ficellus]
MLFTTEGPTPSGEVGCDFDGVAGGWDRALATMRGPSSGPPRRPCVSCTVVLVQRASRASGLACRSHWKGYSLERPPPCHGI